MDIDLLTSRVRTAHGDAWQEQGRLRARLGGGFAVLPGIRLMASGLPQAQWNNGDVTDTARVDLEAVAQWYAELGVPWGVRVPAEQTWPLGRRVFRKRLMGLTPNGFTPAPMAPGLTVRAATAEDLEAVLRIDCAAFEADSAQERPWIEPHLSSDHVTVAFALVDGEPVGTAYALDSHGWAGPSTYLAGVAVLPDARAHGVASAMSAWLLERAFAAGADLAHLHPDDDPGALLYARLGFAEVAGLDVYVDLA
jgi:GNAT superfamily N-acetyltransferase